MLHCLPFVSALLLLGCSPTDLPQAHPINNVLTPATTRRVLLVVSNGKEPTLSLSMNAQSTRVLSFPMPTRHFVAMAVINLNSPIVRGHTSTNPRPVSATTLTQLPSHPTIKAGC